ncbi:hypothetical protein DOTSEDRAFT_179606 [Dothistroma septosporum NZE10]|uniref:Uncharacterized protein n=1 Tax=Dothistroma septosporum (strain NZE10 / CBS 128990) TaxID=675120 RepID=M2WJM5_DOTSN|nr:hypothetical protein DOTSEDRAFT_179606 [Dothistroma septosporum NZE10]
MLQYAGWVWGSKPARLSIRPSWLLGDIPFDAAQCLDRPVEFVQQDGGVADSIPHSSDNSIPSQPVDRRCRGYRAFALHLGGRIAAHDAVSKSFCLIEIGTFSSRTMLRRVGSPQMYELSMTSRASLRARLVNPLSTSPSRRVHFNPEEPNLWLRVL